MAGSKRRPWWLLLGFTLIRIVPFTFLMALAHLVPANIKQAVALIFYGGLLIGAGYYLVFPSRRPAPSERREAFRKPARIMMLGFLLLAAFALVFLTLVNPDGTPPVWVQVALPTLFAGAAIFIWWGNRKYAKQADLNLGKHARSKT